jgi:hypothetical protein
VVDPDPETLNQLFEVLKDWNQSLEYVEAFENADPMQSAPVPKTGKPLKHRPQDRPRHKLPSLDIN